MTNTILKRKLYNELIKWKKEYVPKYALFTKGARRVGKTTIAKEFGRNEYKSYVVINFQSVNDTIRDLFVNSLLDLDYFFNIILINKKIFNNIFRIIIVRFFYYLLLISV